MKAVCVGGGPAGLYFAMSMKLQDPGHDITVLERNPAGSTYGWGVVFGSDLLDKLYRTDPPSAQQVGEAAFRWVSQVVDIHGQQVVDPASSGYGINRQRLLEILGHRAAELGVRVEYSHEVGSLAELPAADLIVAGDGVSSRLRLADPALAGNVRMGGNKYIWLGTDKVFGAFTFPFIDTGSGWIWAHAYGFDKQASTFIVECSAQTWTRLGLDTMPPADTLAYLSQLFERSLDGHQLSGGAGDGVRWLSFRELTTPHWYHGNVVLAGDAAHTCHFSIGSGTKLAIEDSIALAGSLQRHRELEQALAAYQQTRQAELLAPQTEARLSARWLESLPRYHGLQPHQFSALYHARRSPLLPYLPPRLSYQLSRATEHAGVLRGLSGAAAAAARVAGRRRRAAGPGDLAAAPFPVGAEPAAAGKP